MKAKYQKGQFTVGAILILIVIAAVGLYQLAKEKEMATDDTVNPFNTPLESPAVTTEATTEPSLVAETPTAQASAEPTAATTVMPRREPLPANPSASDREILSLVNAERKKAGLDPLVFDGRLMQSSKVKLHDMLEKNYFEHGDFSSFFIDYPGGYKVGENLARQWENNKDMVAGWMKSPTHKAIILDPFYTRFGVATGGSDRLTVTHFSEK